MLFCLGAGIALCLALAVKASEVVNINNFARAETDTYFQKFVAKGALGKIIHTREPTPIGEDIQDVIRMNQDTMYSWVILDLSCPATVTFPDPGSRFSSIELISQDHEIFPAKYKPGSYTITQDEIGTQYLAVLIRTFIKAVDKEDVLAARALQDQWKVEQNCPDWKPSFKVPDWDQKSLDTIRGAFNTLVKSKPDGSRNMFGKPSELDRLNYLLGVAGGWGGLREEDTLYDIFQVPDKHADGKTPYTIHFRDVPIVGNGFWSFTMYNKAGFMYRPGPASLNSVTSKPNEDGSYTLNFGACQDASRVNCLPTTENWNYIIRMYRPGQSIQDGSWKFPKPAVSKEAAKQEL